MASPRWKNAFDFEVSAEVGGKMLSWKGTLWGEATGAQMMMGLVALKVRMCSRLNVRVSVSLGGMQGHHVHVVCDLDQTEIKLDQKCP